MARIDTDRQEATDQRGLVQAVKEALERQRAVDQYKRTAPAYLAGDPERLGAERTDRIAVRLDLINRNDPRALERLIGRRDIVSVNFFARGLQAARAVCRIKTLGTAGGPRDYATGFLATPALLVTSNHVLPDSETASRSLAESDHDLDSNFVERRGRIFPFAPMNAFHTSADLDFTVVAISAMGHDGTPITDFGVLPLIPMSGKGLTHDQACHLDVGLGGTGIATRATPHAQLWR